MKEKMALREPCYKLINGQARWCCGSPGCRHTLATVVSLQSGTVLELPPDYASLRLYCALELYGPSLWINGPARWIEDCVSGGFKKHGFFRYGTAGHEPIEHGTVGHTTVGGRSPGEPPIRLEADKLPVAIACVAGHAVHRLTSLRQPFK